MSLEGNVKAIGGAIDSSTALVKETKDGRGLLVFMCLFLCVLLIVSRWENWQVLKQGHDDSLRYTDSIISMYRDDNRLFLENEHLREENIQLKAEKINLLNELVNKK